MTAFATWRRRLLWITERYPPHPGGMAVSCARQVENLRRAGFYVDVWILSRADPDHGDLRTERDGGCDRLVVVGDHPGTAAQTIFRQVAVDHRTAAYDHVVGFGASFAGHVATTFAAWLSLPSLVSVRGNDFDRDWFDPRLGHLVAEALRRADHVGTVSSEAADRIRALFPGKAVSWIPNGVDAAWLAPLPADRERSRQIRAGLESGQRPVLGLFGELKEKKGIGWWLQTLRQAGLLQRMTLLVVGRTDSATSAILDDPALTPHVARHEFCPRDELPGYYLACDFVALPSLYEGMPNVLLEAMALGRVPIVSDAGAMRDIVIDDRAGIVFTAGDPVAAATAVERALTLTPAARATMGENAAAIMRTRFSPDTERDSLARIFMADRMPAPQS